MSHQYVIPHDSAARSDTNAWRYASPPVLVPRNAVDVFLEDRDRGLHRCPCAPDDLADSSPAEVLDQLSSETYDLESWFCRPVILASGHTRRAFMRSYFAMHRPTLTPDGDWVIPVISQTDYFRSAVSGNRPSPQKVDARQVFVEELDSSLRRDEFPAGSSVGPGHPPVRHPRPIVGETIRLGDEAWWLRSDGWERTRIMGETSLDLESSETDSSDGIYLLPEDVYNRWSVDPIRLKGLPSWADIMYLAQREHVWLI